jgi:Na+:H+ antiporter, NhaA family
MKLLKNFIENEKSLGSLLILCTILSLSLANSSFHILYHNFWETPFFLRAEILNIFNLPGISLTISEFINDGLMSIFFLMVGLELIYEVRIGKLSNLSHALLPIIGALGGMIVPAGVYAYLNSGKDTISGAGIPMATDIAFALGVLSLLGKKINLSLRIFLTALAVMDDLGAILVIVIFYTKKLSWYYLSLALITWMVLLLFKKLKIKYLYLYMIGGIVIWYGLLNSGVHATLAGMLLAFTLPFGDGNTHSNAMKLFSILQLPVNFIILPLFALANTALSIELNFQEYFSQSYCLGIFFGLVFGKPLGIILFTYLACALKLCKLPCETNWKQIIGIGFLGGIGFTMSIFITLLAFNPVIHTDYITHAKIMILFSSLCSGLIGYMYLYFICRKKKF